MVNRFAAEVAVLCFASIAIVIIVAVATKYFN